MFALILVSAILSAAGKRTPKLAMSPKSVAELGSDLRQGKHAKATITVHASDQAGNAGTAKRSVAVRP